MNAPQLKIVESHSKEDLETRMNVIIDEIKNEFISRSIMPERKELAYHIVLERINQSIGKSLSRRYLSRECWNKDHRIHTLWHWVAIKVTLNKLEGSKDYDGRRMFIGDVIQEIIGKENFLDNKTTEFYMLLSYDKELFSQFTKIRVAQWAGDPEINRKGHQILDDIDSGELLFKNGNRQNKSLSLLSRHLGLTVGVLHNQYPELAIRCRNEKQIEYANRLPQIFRVLIDRQRKTGEFHPEGNCSASVFKILKKVKLQYGNSADLLTAIIDNPEALEGYIDLAHTVATTGHRDKKEEMLKIMEEMKRNGEKYDINTILKRIHMDYHTLYRRYPDVWSKMKQDIGIKQSDPRQIWYFDKMGYRVGQAGTHNASLSWHGIKQDWLLNPSQKYVQELMRKKKAVGTIKGKVSIIKSLSRFLEKNDIKKPEDIDRDVIEGYLLEIAGTKTQGRRVIELRAFFRYCSKRKILNLKEDLIWDDDAVFDKE